MGTELEKFEMLCTSQAGEDSSSMWIVIVIFIIGISLLLLLGFCFIAAYITQRKNRVRNIQGIGPLGPNEAYVLEADENQRRLNNKIKELREQLKVEEYQFFNNPLKIQDCSICMGEFSATEKVRGTKNC